MLGGDTTKRADLAPDALVARLQARGVEQLRDEAAIWVVFDGTDLRKPHAERMEGLQPVLRLDRKGTVPGYPTLNVLGIGTGGRRGLLYHKLYSSTAADFLSAPAEERAAIRSVGTALAPLAADVTAIYDSGFDDQAIWGETWEQGMRLVCRLKHRDRLVRSAPGEPLCRLETVAPRLRPLARVETELVVRKVGQPCKKLQPVGVTIAAVPVLVPYRRRTAEGAEEERERACWLVEARLERVDAEPWWLLTDRLVKTAEQATEVFRMYRQRWAIEDAFKVAKTCLGWEDVQVLGYEAVRLLVALGWVAAGFLFELGVTLEWPEVCLLRRLGGGEEREGRPPGKQVLTRGLRRLFDLLATEAILADEVRRHGQLPPRIAAMLGRLPDP
jgi:Transposase DDE domain